MGAIDAQGGHSRQHRGPVPGLERRVDVESRGAVAHCPAYTFGTGQFRNSLPEYARRLGAGRLADHLAADAEPRPAVRPRHERVCERGHPAADDHRAASERHQQFPAAVRLCVYADRSHRPARRLRAVLRRPHHRTRRPDERAGEHGRRGHSERRPARLPGEPVQRAVADQGAARTAVLLHQSPTRVHPA